MGYYQEIIIIPDQEISPHFLWTKIMTAVHHRFSFFADADGLINFGVSFPDYDLRRKSLGRRIRIFAETKQELLQLGLDDKLAVFSEYIMIGSVRPVPEHAGHVFYRKVHEKPRLEVKIRHMMKKKGISFDDAAMNFTDAGREIRNLPRINLVSSTTGNHFPLYIKKEECSSASKGRYNSYGLSTTAAATNATVPEF